ncbi:MAG: hypothetical protein IKL10_03260 [Clostridia bacterium]|nr:hypothetical protein [Clostridia bacterium]
MKKTNKIISIILAMILAFSSLPLMASAGAIDDNVNTVDKLIQSDNLGNLVEWLLTKLNERKEKITPTILRLVFMLVEDESLKTTIGDTNIMSATDEQLAKILVDWLNVNLPEWTKDIYEEEFVSWLIKDVVSIDLSTVNGVVKGLYDLASTSVLGDISSMKETALKNISVEKSGNLNTVYALFQFLADNTSFIKKVLKAEIGLGIGFLFNSTVNNLIKDKISSAKIKEMLCDAVELNYETYKNYSADEIVAVAFLKLLTGKDSVSQSEAGNLMQKSIYGLLEDYAGPIYTNLLVEPLNNDIKALLTENIKPLDDEYENILDKVFNWDYEFKADTFDSILGAGKGNMVAQLNNAVITLLKVILTEDTFKALALEEGGNDKLNENLAKTFRYILPLISNLKNLGVDLSGFTADNVKNMSAEEMAVAVLKLFFRTWFKQVNMEEVNKVKTLEQLAVLAAKYAVNDKEWVPMTINAASKAKDVDLLSNEACIDMIFEIGMETAAKALLYNADTTYFTLPADTTGWSGIDYLDQIVDWAINFAKGIPAIAELIPANMDKLDDGADPFMKLNIILNSLVDLSFISGCGDKYFSFDIETMLMDKFLGNLLNFDIEAAVAILAENESSEIFNKKVNVAVIGFIDDIITSIFEVRYPIALGDVDFKDGLKANDARLTLRASVNLENLNIVEKLAADVSKDTKIKAEDARFILRASVGLENLA